MEYENQAETAAAAPAAATQETAAKADPEPKRRAAKPKRPRPKRQDPTGDLESFELMLKASTDREGATVEELYEKAEGGTGRTFVIEGGSVTGVFMTAEAYSALRVAAEAS